MIRKFHLQRTEDESGVSGTGRVAEGVVFSNGWVAMTWLTRHTSTAIYTSLHEVERIHGHGGKTKVVMDEEDGYVYEPLEYKTVFEIGKADNGWTIREYESGTLLVADESSHSTEHEAFANMLWSIISNFGPSDSKYSTERLMISVIPGLDCEGARLEKSVAYDKAGDHLDYALRFLRNVEEKSPELDEIISKLEDVSGQLFPTI